MTPPGGRVLNPVEVEQAIVAAADEVTEGVDIVTQRLQAYRDAERAFDLKFAMAFMEHKGPQTEKRYAAEIAATDARHDMDAAEVAYRYAERRCKAAESRLSAYQSVNKSVSAMYGAAGRGEY
jgi:hypothetical protein